MNGMRTNGSRVTPLAVASGAIASFNAQVAAPLKILKADITPVQEGSGDPSPDNIMPISGWDSVNVLATGINIWDEEWEVGSIDTTTGNNSVDNNVIRSKNYISCIPNTNYYCTVNPYRYFVYDKNKNFIGTLEGNRVFTTPSNAYFIRFRLYSSYGTTYNKDISINYPSTDTIYHAYNGQTDTIPLPQTVYGGSLDVKNGILTITKKYIKINEFFNFGFNETYYYGIALLPYNERSIEGSAVISNMFKQVDTITPGGVLIIGSRNITISLADQTITTKEDANEWLAEHDVYVVYVLNDPVTISISGSEMVTKAGNNNIWADSGNTTACYLKGVTT